MITKERFLSAGFNNLLALILGGIVVVYVGAVFANATWSVQSGFTGLALLGALY